MKVERIRTVLASGEEDTIEAVKKGELSVNKAYNAVTAPKKDTRKQQDAAAFEPVIEDEENDINGDTGLIDEPYVPSLFEAIREMSIADMAGFLFRVQNENKSTAEWAAALSEEADRYGV